MLQPPEIVDRSQMRVSQMPARVHTIYEHAGACNGCKHRRDGVELGERK